MTAPTWIGPPEPTFPKPSLIGWLLVFLRGVPLILVILVCLLLLLLIRLPERPLFGMRRPATPYITVGVCRFALWIMGFRYVRTGRQMRDHGAMVANHSSWMDIFSLNAGGAMYFVSKSEVANWPGIGWLARATGTLFITRDRRHAKAQTKTMQDRLLAGHKLLFFPEGTSTDGLQVIPFKSTLFAPFMTKQLQPDISVQPVSVTYHSPLGEQPGYYGWWGDMEFAPNLLHILSTARQGTIEITYHAPIKVSEIDDRKTLAKRAETCVRAGHQNPAK